MQEQESIFKRNPNKTRLVVVAAAILFIDPTAGAVRRHLHQKVVAAEKTYRIKSDVYDHGLRGQ